MGVGSHHGEGEAAMFGSREAMREPSHLQRSMRTRRAMQATNGLKTDDDIFVV